MTMVSVRVIKPLWGEMFLPPKQQVFIHTAYNFDQAAWEFFTSLTGKCCLASLTGEVRLSSLTGKFCLSSLTGRVSLFTTLTDGVYPNCFPIVIGQRLCLVSHPLDTPAPTGWHGSQWSSRSGSTQVFDEFSIQDSLLFPFFQVVIRRKTCYTCVTN